MNARDTRPPRLAGKVAIVTGAAPSAPGIGNGTAAAILFAREGAKVLLVNRSQSRAEELQQAIAKEGGECSVCAADVTRAADVERMVETAIQRYGKLDILHNNVGGGAGAGGRLVDISEDDWDRSMALNLKSMMLCCKSSIPRMIASGGGSIVNVSSLAGVVGVRDSKTGLAAYSTAKAGVSGLTRVLAAEHAADGIRVNCIIVGMVDTPIVAYKGPEVLEKRRLAGGRDFRWGTRNVMVRVVGAGDLLDFSSERGAALVRSFFERTLAAMEDGRVDELMPE